jgi:hypothetical protein
MTKLTDWITSHLPSQRSQTRMREQALHFRPRSDDPHEELERYRAVIADAVEYLNQSRCAAKSESVKHAKALLNSLLR